MRTMQRHRQLCETKMQTETAASGVNPFELSFVRRIHSVAQRTILTRAHEAAKPDCWRLITLLITLLISIAVSNTATRRAKQAVCIGHTVSNTISALLLAQVAAVNTQEHQQWRECNRSKRPPAVHKTVTASVGECNQPKRRHRRVTPPKKWQPSRRACRATSSPARWAPASPRPSSNYYKLEETATGPFW